MRTCFAKNDDDYLVGYHQTDPFVISRCNDVWEKHNRALEDGENRASTGPYKDELLVFAYEYLLKFNPSVLEPEIVKICT